MGITNVLKTEDDTAEAVLALTGGQGPSVTIDCSGSDQARLFGLQVIATWGRAIFVGFGGRSLTIDAGALVLQKQLTLRGSWVCSLGQMEEAAAFLVRHDLHPGKLAAREYSLSEGAEAYAAFAAGAPGKFSFNPAT